MAVYWGLRSIPEFRNLTRAERNRRWRRCLWKALGHPQAWIGLVLCGACAAVGLWSGSQVTSNVALRAASAGLGGAIGGFAFLQFVGAVIRRCAREEAGLQERQDAEGMT
jgi:hypothetical protein